MKIHSRAACVTLSMLIMGYVTTSAATRPAYTLVPIEPPIGSFHNSLTAINNRAHVAAWAATEDWAGIRTFLWSEAGTAAVPPLPGSLQCLAFSINNRDCLVGIDVAGAGDVYRAWFWKPGMPALWTLAPLRADDLWLGARAINSAGQIAGFSGRIIVEEEDAVFWPSYDALPTKLETLPSAPPMTGALAMNDNDPPQIAGWAGTWDDASAVVWNAPDQAAQALPKIPGEPYAVAFSINDKGQIVGISGSNPSTTAKSQAVLWEQGEVIPLAPGYSRSEATWHNAINNRGQIVGMAALPDGAWHATLWETQGNKIEMIDLNDRISAEAGVVLTYGDGINNAGCIVADGYYAQEPARTRAFFLVPRQ